MADAFENILGQPKVREFLRASVVSERGDQAYLFVGPAGSNKTQAAYALAQALMCPKGPRGPRGGSCGACDRCGRILRRKHPDVRYFAPPARTGIWWNRCARSWPTRRSLPFRPTRRSTFWIAWTSWARAPPTRS